MVLWTVINLLYLFTFILPSFLISILAFPLYMIIFRFISYKLMLLFIHKLLKLWLKTSSLISFWRIWMMFFTVWFKVLRYFILLDINSFIVNHFGRSIIILLYLIVLIIWIKIITWSSICILQAFTIVLLIICFNFVTSISFYPIFI